MSGRTVALLTVTSPPGPPQGVAAYSIALARALAAAGVGAAGQQATAAPPDEIVVWAPRTHPSPSRDDAASLADEVPPRVPPEGGPPLPILQVWRPGAFAGPDVFAQIRRVRPAVLHVQVEFAIFGGAVGLASLLGGLAAARRLLRQRVVVTLHQVPAIHDLSGTWLRRSGVRMPAWMARAGLRLVLATFGRLADAIVVHAEVFRERLRSEWGVTRPAHVVPHGVTVMAAPSPSRRQSLLLFGYLKWYKGIEIAIETFRRVADEFPGWTLIIAGPSLSAAYVDMLRRLARPLGPRVEFSGRVDEPAVDELLARAGIVLFPYRSLFSASGPLARAMGAAAPFVISEPIRPLCPRWPHWAPLDPDAWVGVLRPMMRDAQIRSTAGDLAAEIAQQAAWPVVAARTRTIYDGVLS